MKRRCPVSAPLNRPMCKVEANRTLALLSKMFSYARPENPCKGIEKWHEVKRDRWLTRALGMLETLDFDFVQPPSIREVTAKILEPFRCVRDEQKAD